MKIFRHYIHKSLLKNPMRTAVTVIGIILSTAMFTAVLVSVNSFFDYLRRLAVEENGNYHLVYLSSDDGKDVLKHRDDVESTQTLSLLGFAEIDSRNEKKPYLAVMSMSEHFTDLVSVHLLSGRMPENKGEILLPGHLRTDGGVKTSLGERLNLTLGKREIDGFALKVDNFYNPEETFTADKSRSYTVVGYYERFSYDIDPSNAAGYMALTVGESGGKNTDTFTFVKAKSIYRTGSLQSAIVESPSTTTMKKNGDLYRGSGLLSAGSLMLVVTFVPFLMLLILFGSVALIYNSFSISLSERTRQMGILNSVGATKKQLRASVRYEAFVLCLIGVPLGILSGIAGIGVTFYLLRDSILSALGNGLYIKLAVSSWTVVISAIVAVFTVFLSASIPARRALRFNAVEAIRQTSDVKMPKRMGKGGLWSRIFHLEGQLAYKNSRRFKKRHNATVFSIVVSIVLFVAAYTFSTDLAMSAYFSSEVSSYDMFCTVLLFRDKEELLSLYKDLSSIPEVKNSALIYERGYALLPLAGAPVLTDASKYDEHLTGAEELYCQIMTVDRENYLKLLETAGIAIPPQGEEFPALLIDHNTKVTEKPDGSRYYENYSIFDHDAFPFTFSVNTDYIVKDGITYIERGTVSQIDVTGEEGPVRYMKFLPRGKTMSDCKEDEILYLTEEEFENLREKKELEVVAALPDGPWYLERQPALIVPKNEVNVNDMTQATVYFQTDDPDALEEKLVAYSENESMLPLYFYNVAKQQQSERALLTVIKVFAYGFIALISLISVANVFNTISTGVILRRREFAMLRSIGMTNRGFTKMMCCESMLFGVKGLLIGLPGSMLVCFLFQQLLHRNVGEGFPLPWLAMAISALCVFIVVFISMFYAVRKIRKDNPLDALKNENI